MSHASDLLRSGKPRHQRGLNRPLKVSCDRIPFSPNASEHASKLRSGFGSKQRTPPLLRIQNVN